MVGRVHRQIEHKPNKLHLLAPPLTASPLLWPWEGWDNVPRPIFFQFALYFHTDSFFIALFFKLNGLEMTISIFKL